MNYYFNASSVLSMDPFPKINKGWYKSGFPVSIDSQKSLMGEIINFIPVDIIAKGKIKNSTFKIKSDEIGNYAGYIDSNGKYHNKVSNSIALTNIESGARALTLFFKKGSYAYLKDCKIHSRGNWKLIKDFDKLNAGNSANRNISYKQGVNKTDAKKLSYTVGAKVNVYGTVDSIVYQLSNSLSRAFNTTIKIIKKADIKDTVSFGAQKSNQRIAVYQFCRYYFIKPGKAFLDASNEQRNNSRQLFYDEINMRFNYKTNYIQKVFVLA
ncbi:hypothetical protein PV797_18350 [Clostridiaceae bacterium M8S5]|nr:hypothetical protein PV797_18350 [Clostridiaceae bacterium M8S5]